MSYTPSPDDIRCANCREWYHKALRACPMCDAPNVPQASYPRRAAPGTPPPPIQSPALVHQKPEFQRWAEANPKTFFILLAAFVAVVFSVISIYSIWIKGQFVPVSLSSARGQYVWTGELPNALTPVGKILRFEGQKVIVNDDFYDPTDESQEEPFYVYRVNQEFVWTRTDGKTPIDFPPYEGGESTANLVKMYQQTPNVSKPDWVVRQLNRDGRQ